MGADKPVIKERASSSRTIILLPVGVAILIVVALFRTLDFTAVGGHSPLSPKEELKLQKRLKEIDDSEQYALVAKMDGYYACLNGPPTYYLKAGEIWKYGVTTKGELGRYKGKFLFQNNVTYIVQFRGNIAECLQQEQIKLFMYPYLPENLARPTELQLPRPPYNPIMK